jgi:hypothetical protein
MRTHSLLHRSSITSYALRLFEAGPCGGVFYFRTNTTPRTKKVALTRKEVALITRNPIGPNGIDRYEVGMQSPLT